MTNYENTNNSGERRNRPAPLPAGGYVARITDAKRAMTSRGTPFIDITVEIIEGEYTGWFRRDYDARCGGIYEPKHRGHYKLWLPRNDGSSGEDRRVVMLESTVKRILGEEEAKMWSPEHPEAFVGRDVGIVTREAEFDGHPYVEIGKLLTTKAAREGNFTPLQKKIIHRDDGDPQTQVPSAGVSPGFIEGDGEDLPF